MPELMASLESSAAPPPLARAPTHPAAAARPPPTMPPLLLRCPPTPAARVKLTIKSAHNMHDKAWLGKSDPYW